MLPSTHTHICLHWSRSYLFLHLPMAQTHSYSKDWRHHCTTYLIWELQKPSNSPTHNKRSYWSHQRLQLILSKWLKWHRQAPSGSHLEAPKGHTTGLFLHLHSSHIWLSTDAHLSLGWWFTHKSCSRSSLLRPRSIDKTTTAIPHIHFCHWAWQERCVRWQQIEYFILTLHQPGNGKFVSINCDRTLWIKMCR